MKPRSFLYAPGWIRTSDVGLEVQPEGGQQAESRLTEPNASKEFG
jgi:hypothetical protein